MPTEATAAPTWRKSSRSNDQSLGCCVEVADLGQMIGVRDSKDPDGHRLNLSPAAWNAFTAKIKDTP